ncbi:MAG: DUF4870 domain-containing protein [Planctomycetes bacterium]|nr:DUF4870 domain-containing protein [Planctomycetota bacterium]
MAEEENAQEAENTEDETKEQSTPDQSATDKEVGRNARMWAMFCHLAGLGAFIIPGIGNIVATLIIWQLKKEDDPFVDNQGKEALNFQITVTLGAIASSLLIPFCIGVPLLIAVGVGDIVFLLIAAVKANDGQNYRYPLAIRFIK